MLAFSSSDFPDAGERKLYEMNEKCLKPLQKTTVPK